MTQEKNEEPNQQEDKQYLDVHVLLYVIIFFVVTWLGTTIKFWADEVFKLGNKDFRTSVFRWIEVFARPLMGALIMLNIPKRIEKIKKKHVQRIRIPIGLILALSVISFNSIKNKSCDQLTETVVSNDTCNE